MILRCKVFVKQAPIAVKANITDQLLHQWFLLYVLHHDNTHSTTNILIHVFNKDTSNGSWCMRIKGEMSGKVCVTFTWYMYIYELFIAFVCFVICSLL